MDLQLCVAKINSNSSSYGASMVEKIGGRRRAERRERDVESGGIATGKEEKDGKGLGKITKMPLSLFSAPNCSILDTASLIYNPNSEPKINNTSFHRLLVPKYIYV